MKIFDLEEFAHIQKQPHIQYPENYDIIQPKANGLELLIQYLHHKYKSNICHPARDYSLKLDGDCSAHYSDVRSISSYLGPYISRARKQPGEYRQAFILQGDSGHAVFMVFLKTANNEEAVLLSDSTMGNPSMEWLQEVLNVTKVSTLYSTRYDRQADESSCIMDALVMGRESTGMSPETGDYLIPDLMEKLAGSAGRKDGIFAVKLPARLLKTAQRSTFIQAHQDTEHPDQPVHKQESLAEFRSRYRQVVQLHGEYTEIPGYLQAKAMKYSRIMELQFYLNQIEDLRGSLSPEERNAFIHMVKQALKSQKSLDIHAMAEDYLSTLQPLAQDGLVVISTPLSLTDIAQQYGVSCADLEQLCIKLQKASALCSDDLPMKGSVGKRNLDLWDRFYQGNSVSTEENLQHLLEDPTLGLAATLWLLQDPPSNLSPVFWLCAASISLEHAALVIHSQTLIYQLKQREALLIFAYPDAYVAKKMLEQYTSLFTPKQQEALEFAVGNRSQYYYPSKLGDLDEERQAKDSVLTSHNLFSSSAPQESLTKTKLQQGPGS